MNVDTRSAHVDPEASLLDAGGRGLAVNVRAALAFIGLAGPIELQVLGAKIGRYDESRAAHATSVDAAVALAAEAEKFSAQGVYLLPSRLKPGVETRLSAPGRWYAIPKRGGTTDSDIAARQVLAVDLDVERPSNTSATDEEMARSVSVALRCFEYLSGIVGVESIAYVHSGNGRQLWLALDGLPVTAGTKAILAATLAGFGSLFSSDFVHVDQTLVDAKRILPCAGTTKRKGAPGIADRPHRRTAIVASENVKRLTQDQLTALLDRLRSDADEAGRDAIDKCLGVKPAKPATGTSHRAATSPFETANGLPPYDVAVWLGLIDGDQPRCPGCGEADSGVAILDHGFKCSHNRCQGRGKNGFRTAVDLTMEVRGLDKFQAVNALAERFGFEPLPEFRPRTSTQTRQEDSSLEAPPGFDDGFDQVMLSTPPPDNVIGIHDRKKLKAVDEPWPEIFPFDRVDLPSFPVDALAPWQRDWARAEAEFCQVPIDMPAVLSLASASLAASRGVDVEVRPGWKEPTNIWVVCAAMPGERKSPVFSDATLPVFAYQKYVTDLMAPKVAEYESTKRVLQKQVEAAESAMVKGKLVGGCSPTAAIAGFHQQLAELKEVSPPVLLSDDATAEAVAMVLETSQERLGIFSAEGGIFELMAGRYSENGANLEIWLKSHSGDAHIVHRVKRRTIFLKRPLLTMAVTTQPSVIDGLAAKEGFRGKGLLARFLYCLPVSTMGSRNSEPPQVSEGVKTAYGAAMLAMLAQCSTRPRLLHLSRGASEARVAFQDRVESRLGPDGDLASVADWCGKLVGMVARIAGVLHVSDYAHQLELPPSDIDDDGVGMPNAIPLKTWLRAQVIGEYALAHAINAFGIMGADETESLAAKVWAWVGRNKLTRFSERDAYRAVHAKAETIAAPLQNLIDRGMVRLLPVAPGAGRPNSPEFEVNPSTGTTV